MATIEIVLLVIGVIMMVGSFFITEKLSNGDLDKIAELSTAVAVDENVISIIFIP